MDKMQEFLTTPGDRYAILQIKDGIENDRYIKFFPLDLVEKYGLKPEEQYYEAVYNAPLEPYQNLAAMLEGLFTKFNISRPEDFHGHSMSVSDIVAIRQNGMISCHYVDSFGFKELPNFLKPENYLRNAEMALEDDYGMVDGIINNGKAADTPPSIEDRLKAAKAQVVRDTHPKPQKQEER